MIGRSGVCLATVLNPSRANVDAYPVPVALGERVASNGYASTAGAPPAFASRKAPSINAAVTPRRRYPMRTYKHEIAQTAASSTRRTRQFFSIHGNCSRGVT